MKHWKHYDEINLVERLRKGYTDAYLQLYNYYHASLYHYVLRFIKIPELAEDAMQEVFLKIWKIRERLNPGLSFSAYLYRISRNQAFKLLKKIAADDGLRLRVMLEFHHTAEDADTKTRWNQYELLLATAVSRLPPQRQKVFKLCREQGKSYEFVSQELGISRNTVKEHMVLAVRYIKEYFLRYGDISLAILLCSGNVLTRQSLF
jgi:RNA polymerase sigma-70 factor (ECF subfamily)